MKNTPIQIPHHDRCVHGKAWFPDTPGKHPLIIFSHGYNGSMLDFQKSAEFFACQGFVAVTLTFCGGSTADPSDYPSTDMSVLTEKEDLLAVFDTASAWEDVDPTRIILFGGSQGGLVSALTAAELKEKVRGLILLYPALCIEDDWTERYPSVENMPEQLDFWGLMLGRKYAADAHSLRIYDHIPKYTGPVLIMHGTNDEIVPCSYSIRAQSLYQNAELIPFVGEHHGFTEENNRRVDGASACFVHSILQD